MKLLMVSAPLPRPKWGASARNFYLLKALARRHQVSLLVFSESADERAADDLPLVEELVQTVQVIPHELSRAKRWRQLRDVLQGRSYLLHLFLVPEMQAALDALLAQDRFDAVLFESVLMAGYRLPDGVKRVIDQHNLEFEVLQRTYQLEPRLLRKWYNWQEYRLLRRGELERCSQADLALVTSERERNTLKQLLPRLAVEVVSNGVDVDAFTQEGPPQELPHQLVLTGTMDYYPNTQGAIFFAEQCWPLIRAQVPDATWLIVGRNPPPEVQRLAELPGVTVTGWVADTRPYLASSAVALAPLLVGGGTRLKILEALAMQKAVVSTSLGCEGLAVEAGKHLLVEDQPERLAEAVIALLHAPERRRALGCAGRSLVERRYSWESCGEQLLRALERIS